MKQTLEKKEPFSFDELKNSILKAGGFLRVYGGVSIGEFVNMLEEREEILFNPKNRKYSATEKYSPTNYF